ncbi:MAG: hypothetical protein IKH32_04845 [Prevotella sp.]|nr:hypothetical protein [Prevotella sp.]
MTVRFRHIAQWVMMTVLLGSCDHDAALEGGGVVPEPEISIPIAFTAQQQEQDITRAGSPLESKVNFFKVYGFKNMTCNEGTANNPTDDDYSDYQEVFPGYVVNWVANTAGTSTTNSDGWEYVNQQPLGQEEQTIKYWDWNAKAYRFFAVAGADGTNQVTATTKTINAGTADEYEVYELTYNADAEKEATDPTAVPYYSRLWFSSGNTSYGHRPFGQPVELEFIKPFSKVRFIFTFEDPTLAKETELKEKRFHPTDNNTIKTSGKVTITYPLTGTGVRESFHATAEAGGISAFTQDYYATVEKPNGTVTSPYFNADENATGIVYTVLPAIGQGTYILSLYVGGDPKSTIVPAEFMDWLPGYSYTYIFKVHVDKSVSIDAVQSAFTEWEEFTADHTVYNW